MSNNDYDLIVLMTPVSLCIVYVSDLIVLISSVWDALICLFMYFYLFIYLFLFILYCRVGLFSYAKLLSKGALQFNKSFYI